MRKNSVFPKLAATLSILVLLASFVLVGWGIQPTEPEVQLAQQNAPLAPERQPPLAEEVSSDTSEPTERTEPEEPTEPSVENTESSETEAPSKTEEPSADIENSAPNQDTEHDGAGTAPDQNPNPDANGAPVVPDGQTRIVTDLTDCILTYRQLNDDVLPFEAYLVDATPEMYLRVKVQNSQTPQNGTYLTGQGKAYRTTLARGERNTITLYLAQGNQTLLTQTYTILYQADKADADTPEVGEHPPTLTTSLDGWSGEMTNRNYTLVVGARTWRGDVIYASNLQVRMDGVLLDAPTGTETFEYELTFPDPVVGDRAEHTVTVLAWDDEGNSVFRSYTVIYRFVDTGGVTGTAYLFIDATTVGLGIPEAGYSYELRQDEPASYAVLAMLADYGYDVQYSGTPEQGMYLKRIFRSGLCDAAQVPEGLWNKILADGLVLTGQKNGDSLGEFDYTQGAGWMYSVNGTLYAGKSLSDYYLSDGDTLYLRFTLAYGKDIGGSGDGHGVLPTYCGQWLNGGYIDLHTWNETVQEPTCTEDGSVAAVCAVCGDRREEELLPALGHDWTETETGERVCARCGEKEVPDAEDPTLYSVFSDRDDRPAGRRKAGSGGRRGKAGEHFGGTPVAITAGRLSV